MVERCLYQVCIHLGISADGVPEDATRSLRELFRILAFLKADRIQDTERLTASKLKTQGSRCYLGPTERMEQLELAFLTQSSVALAAL